MKKEQSGDGICRTSTADLKKDVEQIFSMGLFPPIFLIGAFLYLFNIMSEALEKDESEDPVANVWWSGPIFFTIAYLIMIFAGKAYMKDRPEFKIKPYIFAYNTYQCLFNTWCLSAMIYEVYTNPWFRSPWGNFRQPGPAGFRISYLVWAHYNNKFVELLDTVWMILRKKNEQVSFLHCYHHVLLIWAWFLVCKVETGGDTYFGSSVNSLIHIIMYGYYTLALLNIPCPWKRWITNCQMIQFAVCMAHSIYVLFVGKNAPPILPLAQGFVMLNMLVLFGRFYMKSYMKKTPGKKTN